MSIAHSINRHLSEGLQVIQPYISLSEVYVGNYSATIDFGNALVYYVNAYRSVYCGVLDGNLDTIAVNEILKPLTDSIISHWYHPS